MLGLGLGLGLELGWIYDRAAAMVEESLAAIDR